VTKICGTEVRLPDAIHSGRLRHICFQEANWSSMLTNSVQLKICNRFGIP